MAVEERGREGRICFKASKGVKRVSPLAVVNNEKSLPSCPSFIASTTRRTARARLHDASCSRCLRGTIAAGTLTTTPPCPPFLLVSGRPSAGAGADRSAVDTSRGRHRKGSRRRRAAAWRSRSRPRRTRRDRRAVTRPLAPDVSIGCSALITASISIGTGLHTAPKINKSEAMRSQKRRRNRIFRSDLLAFWIDESSTNPRALAFLISTHPKKAVGSCFYRWRRRE
ncbi:hypothetical protein C4D60_Mb06t12040 [Musa balbisiana]|uniref:Uncharacterized protein n=1 Tax=Musa balbisiana TaxID=52838 RepID=A0A4S8IMG1_MUSBA|nr:hypothetical protein C4D60_Mb06t12040 [Musa balbisiana]